MCKDSPDVANPEALRVETRTSSLQRAERIRRGWKLFKLMERGSPNAIIKHSHRQQTPTCDHLSHQKRPEN
jgi:hypothetical protein